MPDLQDMRSRLKTYEHTVTRKMEGARVAAVAVSEAEDCLGELGFDVGTDAENQVQLDRYLNDLDEALGEVEKAVAGLEKDTKDAQSN